MPCLVSDIFYQLFLLYYKVKFIVSNQNEYCCRFKIITIDFTPNDHNSYLRSYCKSLINRYCVHGGYGFVYYYCNKINKITRRYIINNHKENK